MAIFLSETYGISVSNEDRVEVILYVALLKF